MLFLIALSHNLYYVVFRSILLSIVFYFMYIRSEKRWIYTKSLTVIVAIIRVTDSYEYCIRIYVIRHGLFRYIHVIFIVQEMLIPHGIFSCKFCVIWHWNTSNIHKIPHYGSGQQPYINQTKKNRFSSVLDFYDYAVGSASARSLPWKSDPRVIWRWYFSAISTNRMVCSWSWSGW